MKVIRFLVLLGIVYTQQAQIIDSTYYRQQVVKIKQDLLVQIQIKDFEQAKEIYKVLVLTKPLTDQHPFFSEDHLLIAYFVGYYDLLLENIIENKYIHDVNVHGYAYQLENDIIYSNIQFTTRLRMFLKRHETVIIDRIQLSSLAKESKDILIIKLRFLNRETNAPDFLNEDIERFRETYPLSLFIPYLMDHIYYQRPNIKDRIIAHTSLGASLFDNNSLFDGSISFSAGIDYTHHFLGAGYHYYSTSMNIKNSFQFRGHEIKDGFSSSLIMHDFRINIVPYENDVVRINPYYSIGFGFLDINTEEYTKKNSGDLKFERTWVDSYSGYGINIDIGKKYFSRLSHQSDYLKTDRFRINIALIKIKHRKSRFNASFMTVNLHYVFNYDVLNWVKPKN